MDEIIHIIDEIIHTIEIEENEIEENEIEEINNEIEENEIEEINNEIEENKLGENEINIQNAINKLFNNNVKNYIFVYTPPKVGSTTLVSSLKLSLRRNYKIIHIHDEVMLKVLTGINNVSINDIIHYLSKKDKNVFVFDIYRNPIERKMSEYFEKLSSLHFNNTDENVNNYSIHKITNRFNDLFPHLANEEHYFEKYGIVPTPFDFEKKYSLQILNNIKYIKIRLSDINDWTSILKKIFNYNIVLVTDYQTENKTIGNLYKNFKNSYCLPNNFYELIKNCKYFNFYCTDEERNNYLNKYKNNLTIQHTPYTIEEYKFYLNLSFENQIYNYIQKNHYIDDECICKICVNKRFQLYNKAKNGEVIEKSTHEQNYKEYIERKNNSLIEIGKKIKKINDNISKNKNKNRNVLNITPFLI